MKIEIVTKNIPNETMVREFVQQKVQFGLDRFDNRVERVTVRLEDETENLESFDGYCYVKALLSSMDDISVSSDGESAEDSVLQAIQKMQNAIVNIDPKR